MLPAGGEGLAVARVGMGSAAWLVDVAEASHDHECVPTWACIRLRHGFALSLCCSYSPRQATFTPPLSITRALLP